jgi:copper(I)-binding protein
LVPVPAIAQTPSVQVQRAWARATPGGGHTGAVYLTLLAEGAPDRLTGASTPVAGAAMLHESYEDHGVARMRMLDGVDLPTGKPVVLKPGGMHIMLTGLKQPLSRGSSFPLTLTFQTAPPATVTVSVLAPGASGPAENTMPGMKMP